MTSAPTSWRSVLEALGQDPALAPFARHGAAFLWSAEGARVLAANPRAEAAMRAASGFAREAHDRLVRLAQGLAPLSGVRLERLDLGGGFGPGPVTCACRRVRLADGSEGLLVVAQANASALGDAGAQRNERTPENARDYLVSPAKPAPVAESTVAERASQPLPPVPAKPKLTAEALRAIRRLTWESDGADRLVAASASFAELLDLADVPAIVGRTWGELLGARFVDRDGAIAKAVAARKTWSGIPSVLRAADGKTGVALDFSASPILAADRSFAGYRGFARIDPDGLVALAQPAAEMAAAAAPVEAPAVPAFAARDSDVAAQLDDELDPHFDADEKTTGESTALDAPLAAVDEQLAEDSAASQGDEPPDEDWLDEERLRHARTSDETGAHTPGGAMDRPSLADPQTKAAPAVTPLAPPAPANGDPTNIFRLPVKPSEWQPVLTPAKPALTTAERSAFREIAKALGARIEGDEHAAQEAPEPGRPASPAGDEPVRLPEAAPPEPEAGDKLSVSALRGLSQTVTPDTYAELLDKLPIGVLVNRGQEPIYANRTFLDLLGYQDIADLERQGGLDRLFRGPAPQEGGGAVMLVGGDGEPEPVDARLTSITWAGKPATLMAFRRAFDAEAVAKAKALELDLRVREERLGELSAILDTATDGVVTLDNRGRILSLNKAAEALFGYDAREVTGETIAVLLAPESHVPALDYLEGLKGSGVASLLNDGREVIGRERQGGRVPLFMTMGRVSEGSEPKFCAVLRDITAWKAAEADLTEARKAAERASAQKSDVLAKISHEIRTPLNAIIGFAEVMSEERFGPVGNERYKEYLRDIQQSGGYVISLVNDLLDLAKIEAGKLDLDFTSVNLNDIAASAVSLLQPEAARHRVVLRSGLSPKLPPVVADERSLRQIVINLLSNAVKFTDPGGQVIVSTALGDKGEAVLRVRDTGIGMSEKELQLALEPFRQVSTTRRGGGTGLGLPLTKALVEANRGSFAITSVKGEGTLAEVIFPPQRVLAS